MDTFFRFAVDKRFLPVLLPLGFRITRDGVILSQDGLFRATFGVFSIQTPFENVAQAHITEDYRWWTAVGPRRSFVDDGLTFGTNNKAGVCVHFIEKVPSILRRQGHSALTVTVDDCEGLATSINERMLGPESG